MTVNKSCRTCKHWSGSYGFRNGVFVGSYNSCDYKINIAESCRKGKPKFKLWEEKDKQ